MKAAEIKGAVRDHYGEIARHQGSCCASSASCCGSTDADDSGERTAQGIGYSKAELEAVPEGANLGLGCGNPTLLAALKPGETVLDLGSGAGFDAFLAARRVGRAGKVIGVDMTPEMIQKSLSNRDRQDNGNVEFRLGEIEHLPIADDSIDVVISNCVINLAPDKERVFREAFRVLRPGGRLLVSDIVLQRPLPRALERSVAALTGCIAGALPEATYLEALRAAGFKKIQVQAESKPPFLPEASELVQIDTSRRRRLVAVATGHLRRRLPMTSYAKSISVSARKARY